MTDQWYYFINGKKFGPISLDRLKQLADMGVVGGTTAVYSEGMPDSVLAAEMPQLFAGSSAPNDVPVGVSHEIAPPKHPIATEALKSMQSKQRLWILVGAFCLIVMSALAGLGWAFFGPQNNSRERPKEVAQNEDSKKGNPQPEPQQSDSRDNHDQKPKDDAKDGSRQEPKTPKANGQKPSKDEALYKGKPASFWLNQLKDKDVTFRLDAVNALQEIGMDGEGVFLALAESLIDKEKTVRETARAAIGTFPSERIIPALVELLRGKDAGLRLAVIEVMGDAKTKAKDALPELTKVLGEKDATIRSKAANAVGNIGLPDNSALTALIKLLDDKETSVRLEATKALGEIGTGAEVATSSLFSRLSPKMEKDASIRLQAVKSLWSIAKQKEKVLSAILLACNDPDRNVRDHARTTILPFLIEIDFEAKEAFRCLLRF